jgi:hypothetical protein
MSRRRDVLAAGLLLPLAPRLVLASEDAERLLREGRPLAHLVQRERGY